MVWYLALLFGASRRVTSPWLDSNTSELCSKALPVGHWPLAFLRDTRQLNRLPCCPVEAGQARDPRRTAESIYLLIEATPVGHRPFAFLRDARQLNRLPCCIVEAGQTRDPRRTAERLWVLLRGVRSTTRAQCDGDWKNESHPIACLQKRCRRLTPPPQLRARQWCGAADGGRGTAVEQAHKWNVFPTWLSRGRPRANRTSSGATHSSPESAPRLGSGRWPSAA